MCRMSIGKAADAIGVSAKAIRLWEAKGLVSGIERTPAGYRLFRESDLAVMRFIKRAQALGMTLEEIKRILELQNSGTAPCGHVRQMLDDRITEIDRTLEELAQLRTMLVTARMRAGNASTINNGALVCQIIEQS